MATLKKEVRDKIVAQALQEIVFARTYKQGKVANWQKNENMYYGKKVQPDTSRANVSLGQMQSHVHTILAKIDNPLVFKFVKRKEAQLKRVKRLNSLRNIDSQKDFWDLKDIVGKKQAIIYGRSIYWYYADSYDNYYCAHLENVDVYDFLIDPSAGGIDIERAMYLGRYGVVKTKTDLEEGVKDGRYLRTETKQFIESGGTASESSQEETNKLNRTFDQGVYTTKKEQDNKDKFKFWEWLTTYEGERYYLILNEHAASAIRICPLTDLMDADEELGDAPWPVWTWAAFPDLTEFWTPSFCDYVREVFMAQEVSVNQGLDNSEAVNKPQRVINVGAIENLAELKYRRDGYIKVKKDFDVTKAVQPLPVPPIETPIKMFGLLKSIHEENSGVTAGDKGAGNEDKVAIYEGNQANAADRLGLLNKSYSFGYRRFAYLWERGVRENLITKVAIDILGPNGLDVEFVGKRDLFLKGDKFGVVVEASDAELQLSNADKKNKLSFLTNVEANPLMLKVMNPKKAFEAAASIVGFEEEEIRELLDTSDFGDAELMSEAERDIERILEGQKVPPNQRANNAYKQRVKDYLQDHSEELSDEDFRKLADYVLSLDEIIMRNTLSAANAAAAKALAAMPPVVPGAPGGKPAVGDLPPPPDGGAPVDGPVPVTTPQ